MENGNARVKIPVTTKITFFFRFVLDANCNWIDFLKNYCFRIDRKWEFWKIVGLKQNGIQILNFMVMWERFNNFKSQNDHIMIFFSILKIFEKCWKFVNLPRMYREDSKFYQLREWGRRLISWNAEPSGGRHLFGKQNLSGFFIQN